MTSPVAAPYSREAEEAVISACLMYPDIIPALELDPDDFYIEANRLVYATCRALDRAGRGVDEVTISEALKAKNQFDLVGDWGYFNCLRSVPMGGNVEDYTGIVKDRAERRRGLRAAEELACSAYNLGSNYQKGKAAVVEELMRTAPDSGRIVHISDAISRLYDEVQERAKNRAENPEAPDVWGIDTGFADYNTHTGGWQKGEMVLLSGDPGVGKTLFGGQFCAQAAIGGHISRLAQGNFTGHPGVIFELEMGDVQLCRRIVAACTGIAPRDMRTGRVDDMSKIARIGDISAEIPIWISDSTDWTTAGIRAALTQYKARYNIEWFMVDYLDLLMDQYGNQDHERTNYISKSLRQTCKALNLAGLVIAKQHKAGVQEQKKTLGSLGGSVGLIYDADMVLFMNYHILSESEANRGKKPLPNVRTLTFAKFREDSPNKFLNLTMKPGLPAFVDYMPEARP